ncbi:MAG: ornithine carbamoyltransferase, partial [bacterium]
MKHLISINDLDKQEIKNILDVARDLKDKHQKQEVHKPLAGKTLGMIFSKASTRTRVSFEVGMYQLGGHALFLSASDMQLNRGETIADTAKTLSRYLDAVMVRTYDHEDIVHMATHATIPVINGLSDLLHPCQVLADVYTIKEKKGNLKELKIVYIGDGDNVAHSWAYAAGKLGLKLVICTPEDYKPNAQILKEASSKAKERGGSIDVLVEPQIAAQDADIIYTDIWVSMGKEEESS